LLADIRFGDADPRTALSALASAIVRAINVDKTSPLFRRFQTPGIPAEATQNLTISEAVNGLTRSGLIGRILNDGRSPGPLCGATDIDTIQRARKVLNAYFEKLRSAANTRWECGGTSSYIAINPGIRAHLALIAEIVAYLTRTKNLDFYMLDEEKFASHVAETAQPVFEFTRTATDEQIRNKFSRKFGEAGLRDYLFNLFELVHGQYDDFGSSDFRNWITQRASNKVEEASRIILHVCEAVHNFTIKTLKSVYGSQRLPSGEEAFWENGVPSKRVRDKAYSRQQEDESGKRMPKEAYLDISDLIEVVKEKENWPHFESIFNLPQPGEQRGRKHYLSWMNKLNELRRVAAHKNEYRTYKDVDYEFVDWLKAQLDQKLQLELSADA
jgi:hypothetical protein